MGGILAFGTPPKILAQIIVPKVLMMLGSCCHMPELLSEAMQTEMQHVLTVNWPPLCNDHYKHPAKAKQE